VNAFGAEVRQMIRRLGLILFLWLCSAASVFAQNSESLPIVGVLRVNTLENVEPFPTIFRNALAALGQVDGRNIRIDLRLAEGNAERFPELAQALVREKASVIVASGDAAMRRCAPRNGRQKRSRLSGSSMISSAPG